MNITGLKIVGFRYGKAPENGRSWNTRDNELECGVSMAQVGYDKEFSWSVDTDIKKYYYIGTIAGEGGDGEICLKDIEQITYKEYLKIRKQQNMIEVSNKIVNERFDRQVNLVKNGFSIGKTLDQIEEQRKKYLKK